MNWVTARKTFGEQRSISEKLRDEHKRRDKEMSKRRETKAGGVDGADEEQRLRDMFMFKRKMVEMERWWEVKQGRKFGGRRFMWHFFCFGFLINYFHILKV